MRISLKCTALGLAAFGALAIAAPSAWAGCDDPGSGALKTPTAWEDGKSDGARLIRVANVNGNVQGAAAIAGLWNVNYYVGATSQVWDFGYSEWHPDGTELLISGPRSPATGNVCVGVWTQTGPATYHEVHYVFAYDPTLVSSANPSGLKGRSVILETVNLAAGSNAFQGAYSVTFYPTSGSPTAVMQGTVTGQRLTATP